MSASAAWPATPVVRPDGVRLPGWLAPGAVFLVGRAASPQFAAVPPFRFRVIRVDTRLTYDGWAWLHGYTLGDNGEAVEKRSIFVKYTGLRHISTG
jgi:hypothetical protein